MNPESKVIFSVDVEDWFHILDLPATPNLDEWGHFPSLVEKNFLRLLDLFSEANARVTCFFLGWVAERFPSLVREAANRGHEIASHGYAHRLVYSFQPTEFREDAVRSRRIIEDVTGLPVLGYRSPGFSVTAKSPWFFDELLAAGYRYDSSVFPAVRAHGGLANAQKSPHRITVENGTMTEIPITVSSFAGKSMCFFGGGYLRLFPYPLIKRMTNKVLNEGRPVVFYVHPREIDPKHPRLPMGAMRQFKSYVNLHTTEPKIRRILQQFPVTTFCNYLRKHQLLES
jgi:polysaccharide deacetylase family protein (PEP-CTERM system associated)